MAIDYTSSAWMQGNDINLLIAMGLPISSYSLNCIHSSMEQLETLSPASVELVQALLANWTTADEAEIAYFNANPEGKTLTKADVLEWTVTGGETFGFAREKGRVFDRLKDFFASFPCLNSMLSSDEYVYTTCLIRS